VPTRKLLIVAAAVSGVVLAAGCSSSSSGSGGSTASTANAAKATSAAAFGGMNGLVAACKKEGTLNVITLPANWANYGTIMKDFTARYGVKINDANPAPAGRQRVHHSEHAAPDHHHPFHLPHPFRPGSRQSIRRR
jgi:putative spermidine/putrescine transport system substrate-binding protein